MRNLTTTVHKEQFYSTLESYTASIRRNFLKIIIDWKKIEINIYILIWSLWTQNYICYSLHYK